jgi:hypothetical protein
MSQHYLSPALGDWTRIHNRTDLFHAILHAALIARMECKVETANFLEDTARAIPKFDMTKEGINAALMGIGIKTGMIQ